MLFKLEEEEESLKNWVVCTSYDSRNWKIDDMVLEKWKTTRASMIVYKVNMYL